MARSRKSAVSPRSTSWTLYKPEILAERLGIPLDVVDLALEETGYYKAVKIREDLIKLKTRLKDDSRCFSDHIETLQALVRHYKRRKIWVDHQLEDVRDILRRPREKETRCGTTKEKSNGE